MSNKQEIKIDCKYCGLTNRILVETQETGPFQEIHFFCSECEAEQTTKVKLTHWIDPVFKKKDWYITPIIKETPKDE